MKLFIPLFYNIIKNGVDGDRPGIDPHRQEN